MKPEALVIILVLFVAGAGGGYYFLSQRSAPAPAPDAALVDTSSEHGLSIDVPEGAAVCAEHNVPEVICPFCKPSLVEDLGWCGSHDVAEALCSRCNPTLIAAFKAENDWCAEHGLPESQCALCGGDDDHDAAPAGDVALGAMCDTHHVAESICPFCDPSLIESLGHCGGHDVPEAFCTRCSPALIPAFKAENDWCAEHGLPESQCLECNPPSGG